MSAITLLTPLMYLSHSAGCSRRHKLKSAGVRTSARDSNTTVAELRDGVRLLLESWIVRVEHRHVARLAYASQFKPASLASRSLSSL